MFLILEYLPGFLSMVSELYCFARLGLALHLITKAVFSIFVQHMCANSIAPLLPVGPPSLPSNLNSIPWGLNSLLISWSPSFPFPALISYNVTVVQEGSDDQTLQTNSTSLVFTQREHYCSLLEIYIVSTNPAGSSNRSKTISASVLCKCAHQLS